MPGAALAYTYDCPPTDDACLALAERLEAIADELIAIGDGSAAVKVTPAASASWTVEPLGASVWTVTHDGAIVARLDATGDPAGNVVAVSGGTFAGVVSLDPEGNEVSVSEADRTLLVDVYDALHGDLWFIAGALIGLGAFYVLARQVFPR